MPEIAEFIDALREAFGADEINAIVRRGRAGELVFFAREAGQEFGTPLPAGAGTLRACATGTTAAWASAWRRASGAARGVPPPPGETSSESASI